MSADSLRFATAVNCIDGRVQQPVIDFVRKKYDVEYVDMVTNAGAAAGLNEQILANVKVSVEAHQSAGIVVAAHEDCAGNPISDAAQKSQCIETANALAQHWPDLQVIPLWVSTDQSVEELTEEGVLLIKSPMDGTFYRRPDPTARAFVSPGDEVEETTVMCLIETMKVFNEIKAKCTGTLLEALAKDGDPIELDQPLFRVKTNHD